MLPYRHATRPRKAAVAYTRLGVPVSFISLQGVGRSIAWDAAGTFERDGISVIQVPVREPSRRTKLLSFLHNALLCYLPAFLRLTREVWSTPAAVVQVTGTPLALLGALHKWRHSSAFILDVNERPASASAQRSLAGLVSHVEPMLLRFLAGRADVASVVTPGHLPLLRAYGFRPEQLLTVRNAPLSNWRSSYSPPLEIADRTVTTVVVGTLFEGRGYEMLLESIGILKRDQYTVRLTVCGPSRPEYLARLQAVAQALGVAEHVTWAQAVDTAGVSQLYADSHVGLVLYEARDAANDSLSNKLLECVAAGRPVVASANSENVAFVNKHCVGWLVETTPEGIAQGLRTACMEPDLQALTEHCWSVGTSVANWEVQFEELLVFVQSRLSTAG